MPRSGALRAKPHFDPFRLEHRDLLYVRFEWSHLVQNALARQENQNSGAAQSLVLRHCWIHLLRLHRSDLECSRRSHLGVSLVEPVCTLADLPDRLPALLCDGLLGFRYEDS